MKRLAITIVIYIVLLLIPLKAFCLEVYNDVPMSDSDKNAILDMISFENIDSSEIEGYINEFAVNPNTGEICVYYMVKPNLVNIYSQCFCVYNIDGIFKYGVKTECSGTMNVLWIDDKVHIFESRMKYNTIILNNSGKCEKICYSTYIPSTEEFNIGQHIFKEFSFQMLKDNELSRDNYVRIEKIDSAGNSKTIIECDHISKNRLFFDNAKDSFDRIMITIIPIFFATGTIAFFIIKACIRKKLERRE